ncbi:MAG: hypothetical protein UR28_C0001G0073 [Candidatus Peregrinibacteria bacterium GW2011_GWF2_33_10]|nr:MAG: hypothetical protein UR28_C0001G0073 [Candidatus Peregrinibacteria bacterium GW2011_GWF2_33_10]OGJ44819.1 MAG: hypothetical protein A2263_06300 [Candidatus Peregrinibacteria bacterium RIFOXYA2_FULL_33_21]OGJ47105.1 MAG: hypothetical protein A2272_03020 [Candidatus Peregrinibacteria bacterium RIFOXYA12_FULL_33_12]OGJ50505.1 MAG: hypothetical protein A2307_02925 [Candidatus Peregrinibacteria bacterium RIFOXYB2_FULL_33_20]
MNKNKIKICNAKPEVKFDFAVGGQAVIEGVMMRSANFLTIAVRKPNGELLIRDEAYISLAKKLKAHRIPIIRGVIGLFESLYVGTKALNFSAKVAADDDLKGHLEGFLKKQKVKINSFQEFLKNTGMTILVIFSYVFSITVGLFLFKYIPLVIAELSKKYFPIIADNYILFNTVDGLTKIAIFLLYIVLISLMPDIRRVFEYHGAEHKSIMTYEHHLDLNPKNAKFQTRFHPRCGTSFIFFVLFLSIFIYTLIPSQSDFWTKFMERILLLPFIAGVSYEVLKLSAKYQDNFLIKLFIKPGLAFQHITTKEPNEEELEVGLAALKRALDLEKGREGNKIK